MDKHDHKHNKHHQDSHGHDHKHEHEDAAPRRHEGEHHYPGQPISGKSAPEEGTEQSGSRGKEKDGRKDHPKHK